MKKSILKTVIALLMCLTLSVFCACESGDKDNSSGGKFDSSIPLDDNELPIIPVP